MINYAREKVELPATREVLMDLLLSALPCVEESEEFNSAYALELSKNIRAVLTEEGEI